jgi:putative spermidine/putrescine transport system ATP-binding protein
MSEITLEAVGKRFGTIEAVRDVDLHVAEGEFFSLLGPSGSGKSTVLRIIAGFTQPTTGEVQIGGVSMLGVPAERRDIGYVFQDYALFPHLSVHDNVAFGLRARKVPKREIGARVDEALDQSGLAGYGSRRPNELSGGERQRVAIARALVIRPKVLLLDEPLGALDRMLREQMQFWVKQLQRDLGVTTIHVTHDQIEALTMSDRIAIMRRGEICELGTPQQLYQEPAKRFSAEFMGDNNILAGVVVATDGLVCQVEIDQAAKVRATIPSSHGAAGAEPRSGDRVALAVRPEDIELRAAGEAPDSRPQGRILERIYRGSVIRYRVELRGGTQLAIDSHGRSNALPVGERVVVEWDAERCSLLLESDGDRLARPKLAAGDTVNPRNEDTACANAPQQTEGR